MSKEKEEKKVCSVQDLVKALNGSYGENVLVPADLIPEVERFSMGTLSADYSLFGGLPEGHIIGFAGEAQSGKSVMAALTMSAYQKKHPDRVCIYVDAENALPLQWKWFKKMTGLNTDPEHFLRYDCCGKSADEIFRDLIQLQAAENIGLIVIDSARALVSKADMDEDFTKDNGMRGSTAKVWHKFLKIMVPLLGKRKNTMIIINHVTVNTSPQGYVSYTEPCGTAIDYYSSIKIRFVQRKYTRGTDDDVSLSLVQHDKNKMENTDVDGFVCRFMPTKNRLGPLSRYGAKTIFRNETGVDWIGDLYSVVTGFNIAEEVKKATYRLVDPFTREVYKDEETGEELEFYGRPKFINYLNTHLDFTKKYYDTVAKYIQNVDGNYSTLSEDDQNEILEMERLVEETNKRRKAKYKKTVASVEEDMD